MLIKLIIPDLISGSLFFILFKSNFKFTVLQRPPSLNSKRHKEFAPRRTSAISGVMSPRPELFESIKLSLSIYLSPFLYLRYQGGVPSTPAPGHPFQRPCFKGRSLVLRSLCPGASISAHITQLIESA